MYLIVGLLLAIAFGMEAQISSSPFVFGKADLPLAKGPVGFASGDFNGDGRSDFVAISSDSSVYSVILSRGDGAFAPRADYPLSSVPRRILAADFNADGKLDLAISVAGSISVLLGNGNGTFSAPSLFGGITSDGMTAGDFDGDGKLDIAAAEACIPATGRCTQTEGRLQMLLGNGDGTFKVGAFTTTIAAPFPVAAGDFNGDGQLDLAVGSQTNGVSILLGNGDGTFQPRKDFPATINAIVAGDFNGDGKADLALGATDLKVSVLLSKGDGTFQTAVPYSTAILGLLTALTAADFNGDGIIDLAACGNQQISVLLGKRDGSFPTRADYLAPGYAWAMGASDANGDGQVDLAVVNRTTTNSNGPDSLSVLINRGGGVFNSRTTISVGKAPQGIDAADFNQDGSLDLVVANTGDNTLSVLNGDGAGGFTPPQLVQTEEGLTSVGVFTPKYYPPAAGSSSAEFVKIPKGVTPGVKTIHTLPNGQKQAVVYETRLTIFLKLVHKVFFETGALRDEPDDPDYDGDGNSDLAVVGPRGDALEVVLGNGDNTFKDEVEYDTGGQPAGVTHGDFNGDGKTDLVVANGADNTVSVFLNNGNGTFPKRVDFPTGRGPNWVATGDFNGDGVADVAVTNSVDNSVSVLVANRDGSLMPHVDYPVALGPRFLIAADFNGDGKIDLAAASNGNGAISILLGNGDGTFQSRQTLLAGTGLNWMVAADWDGDGTPDLAATNTTDNTVSVFLNPPVTSGPLLTNAFGGSTTIAPNTWVSLKGTKLSQSMRIWRAGDFVGGQMPTSLDGVSVTISGKNAFVYYISDTLVNVLTPPDLSPGPVSVQAVSNGAVTATLTSQVQQYSPSFFVFDGVHVAAVHLDSSLVGPPALYQGLSTPAKPNETVVLFANGFGPTSVPVVSGATEQSGSLPVLPVVTIGGIQATVSFAGLVAPGEFQFNVVVPASVPDGENLLTATYLGLPTQKGVVLSVQR